MKSGFSHTLRGLFRGQTLLRIRMNEAFSNCTVSGRVVDVGGGRNPDYRRYLDTTGMSSFEAVDGSISGINFERDPLPYEDATVDTVILANVLEHIYNHRYLLAELRRILVARGRLVGFVPFWTGYHPDPHDYFRYTKEALERLLADAGFSMITVTPVGGGPFVANFNTIVLSMPRVFRPALYIPYWLLDTVFLRLRPKARDRNPLGFVFTAHA